MHTDFEADLEDLRWHWGEAYVIECFGLGRWLAQRRDGRWLAGRGKAVLILAGQTTYRVATALPGPLYVSRITPECSEADAPSLRTDWRLAEPPSKSVESHLALRTCLTSKAKPPLDEPSQQDNRH